MTHETFSRLLEARVDKLRATNQTKGVKYNSPEDRLSGIKASAERVGITPYQQWHALMDKHWQAVLHFVQTGHSLGEELIQNHLHDCILFLMILEGLVLDVGELEPTKVVISLSDQDYTSLMVLLRTQFGYGGLSKAVEAGEMPPPDSPELPEPVDLHQAPEELLKLVELPVDLDGTPEVSAKRYHDEPHPLPLHGTADPIDSKGI